MGEWERGRSSYIPVSSSILCKLVQKTKRLKYFIFKNDHSMKKLVILTGAGMSSESGIRTFRDSGGLWEEYDVTEVATPEAWLRNRDLVLRFYNERRRQLACKPNPGHIGLAST